jgi:hypothetical protein
VAHPVLELLRARGAELHTTNAHARRLPAGTEPVGRIERSARVLRAAADAARGRVARVLT